MRLRMDEGYYFGIGAFETMALEDGEPVFFDRHMDRLEEAVKYFEIFLKGKRQKKWCGNIWTGTKKSFPGMMP